MAKLLMIQGTCSDAGKSLIVAGLCRILKRRGFRVAPFKAQNMALNSGVTPDGLEMGRAQILQAEAAGIAPTVYMNPILLKPVGDAGSQVVVLGRPVGNMTAREYHKKKRVFLEVVKESLERLSKGFDVVVMEGAGSPAEINLKDKDIVNMGIAKLVKAPVFIVGDIDRGGVFASLYGTYALLDSEEKKLVKGFIINKFRGDPSLLGDAAEKLEKLTGVPVLGVIPLIKGLILDPEDSVFLEGPLNKKPGKPKIKVIKLPRISNFTDFIPFSVDSRISLEYTQEPLELLQASLVIIPGSKGTIGDLSFLKERGFHHILRFLNLKGVPIMGICGGYQMLGKVVKDPYRVEGGGEEEGIGLLEGETVMEKEKTTLKVKGFSLYPRERPIEGYEIHMGRSRFSGPPFFRIVERGGKRVDHLDGVADAERKVFGTYIHGVFESDSFRSTFLEALGLESSRISYRDLKERMLDELADTIEKSLDLERLLKLSGIS